MDNYCKFLRNSIVTLITVGVTMLFSCENDIKKVKELSDVEQLPAIHAYGFETKYSDLLLDVEPINV